MFSRFHIGAEKYPALTGVRAFGAAVVFFDHFPLWPGAHITINVLSFFFVLSGFLIVRIYYEQAVLTRGWLAKYFVNRFARIYPIYFLLLTVAVFLHHDWRPWLLLKNYTLTHALFSNSDLIIEPSWSLTVEECFYALAPVFIVLARRRNPLAPFLFACLLSVGALGISRLHSAILPSGMFVLSTTFFGHFVEFFAGVYLAFAVMKLEGTKSVRAAGGKRTLVGLAGVTLLVVAMMIVYRHPPLNHFAIIAINNLLIPWPAALLYWGLIRENTWLSRLLSTPLAGLLGRSSYSFYVLHMLIVEYIGLPLLPSGAQYRAPWVLLIFVITWVISILLFAWYEEPLNMRIRRAFRSRDRAVHLQGTLLGPSR